MKCHQGFRSLLNNQLFIMLLNTWEDINLYCPLFMGLGYTYCVPIFSDLAMILQMCGELVWFHAMITF